MGPELTKEQTRETLIKAGGEIWERGSMRRVYFNDLASLIGLEVSRYRSGNIKSARFADGQTIANRRAAKLFDWGAKLYYDLDKREWVTKNLGEWHDPVVSAIKEEVARISAQLAG